LRFYKIANKYIYKEQTKHLTNTSKNQILNPLYKDGFIIYVIIASWHLTNRCTRTKYITRDK